MENKTLSELEIEIAEIRYQLMLKGTELDFVKQTIKASNLNKIDALTKEVEDLRTKLNELNKKIKKLKFAYYVAYEVRFKNTWTGEIQKEIYNETFLLNKDLQIDLPTANDWNLSDETISVFLLELLVLLKHKYDEVTLLKVKRI